MQTVATQLTTRRARATDGAYPHRRRQFETISKGAEVTGAITVRRLSLSFYGCVLHSARIILAFSLRCGGTPITAGNGLPWRLAPHPNPPNRLFAFGFCLGIGVDFAFAVYAHLSRRR